MTTESNGYCERCGARLNTDSVYCPRCGTAVHRLPPTAVAVQQTTTAAATDWREARRQSRAQRRAEHQNRPGPHIGGLVVATILILGGLGTFFPELPWGMFWGAILMLLGVWIAYLWTLRPRGGNDSSSVG